MFGLVVRVTFKDEAAAHAGLTASVVPSMKAMPGFVAGYWMDGKDGKGLSFNVWQDESSAKAGAQAVHATPPDAPVTVDEVHIHEIIASG